MKAVDHYIRINKKTIEKHILFMVHWELTNRCNLNCIHCYCSHNSNRKELSSGEIKQTLDTLAGMQTLFIIFSGGEPLMREDFFTIARYARAKGFALKIMTNGTLITPEAADNIKEINPFSVDMSLYAASPELHDRVTGCPGSFEKTIQAFSLLGERGVKTTAKSVLMRPNVDQLNGLKKLAGKLGAGFVYDFVLMPKNDGSWGPLAYRLTTEEVYQIIMSEGKGPGAEPRQVVDDDTFMCSAGLNNIAISPYGDVYPCVALRIKAGNLREQSLAEIQDSPVLRQMRTTKFSDLQACRECKLARYCRRCPGLAVREGGDFLGPSPADGKLAEVWRRLDVERGGKEYGNEKEEEKLYQTRNSV